MNRKSFLNLSSRAAFFLGFSPSLLACKVNKIDLEKANDLLLIKGDQGAKIFINKRKSEVLCPKSITNFFDIDTKEDLQLFKNQF